ncbi:MAG TPA: hypothetical protein VHC49_02485 [Mycobacteriales bacterium]|nr:hypothetical protein [Mycobacteriales bacterium]
MRVYLPATMNRLSDLVKEGSLGPAPLTAFAVTPALREWYVDDDVESLEYAALLNAARASLRLLDADPAAPRRRVVVAAEVADGAAEVRADLDRAVVQLAEPVGLAQVAAVHVDAPEAEDAVRAAARVVMEADLGGADAQFAVDETEGHELGWYATQEIGPLLELS